jgi:hypothetical protein
MQALGMGDDTLVPVIQVDLAEHEEAQALATFDYITYMAEFDRDSLDNLLREINSDNNSVQELLAEIATNQTLFPPDVLPLDIRIPSDVLVNKLRWKTYVIPLTPVEDQELERMLTAYLDKHGNFFGVVSEWLGL